MTDDLRADTDVMTDDVRADTDIKTLRTEDFKNKPKL